MISIHYQGEERKVYWITPRKKKAPENARRALSKLVVQVQVDTRSRIHSKPHEGDPEVVFSVPVDMTTAELWRRIKRPISSRIIPLEEYQSTLTCFNICTVNGFNYRFTTHPLSERQVSAFYSKVHDAPLLESSGWKVTSEYRGHVNIAHNNGDKGHLHYCKKGGIIRAKREWIAGTFDLSDLTWLEEQPLLAELRLAHRVNETAITYKVSTTSPIRVR